MTEAHANALFKFQRQLTIIHTPLICWDFFTLQQIEFNQFSAVQKTWKEKEDYFKQKDVLIITDTRF